MKREIDEKDIEFFSSNFLFPRSCKDKDYFYEIKVGAIEGRTVVNQKNTWIVKKSNKKAIETLENFTKVDTKDNMYKSQTIKENLKRFLVTKGSLFSLNAFAFSLSLGQVIFSSSSSIANVAICIFCATAMSLNIKPIIQNTKTLIGIKKKELLLDIQEELNEENPKLISDELKNAKIFQYDSFKLRYLFKFKKDLDNTKLLDVPIEYSVDGIFHQEEDKFHDDLKETKIDNNTFDEICENIETGTYDKNDLETLAITLLETDQQLFEKSLFERLNNNVETIEMLTDLRNKLSQVSYSVVERLVDKSQNKQTLGKSKVKQIKRD